MKIGFTGTRYGMTFHQTEKVKELILEHAIGHENEAHHGDCIGADAEFHNLVKRCSRAKTIGHPGFPSGNPTDTSRRAFCDVDEMREAKAYFARNRDIVTESDVLIATPFSMDEKNHGGTWHTISYSRSQKKPRYIVYPDGSVGE